MDRWQVPGLAMAVVKDSDVVLSRGYGLREIDVGSPVNADTVFPIASCTKSFTACCIAMLVDDGVLNWDDPVRKHLPDFQVADPYVTEHVTIRDLLCHRTGLVRGDLIGMSGGFTHEELLGRIRFLPQAKPFRTKVTYNNLMYTVLGEIVSRKSGMPWNEFVEKRVFEPLEMDSSTCKPDAVPASRLATRHRLYDQTVRPLQEPATDIMFPAGGIHSTAGDMASWLRLQLQLGRRAESQIVSEQAIREMHALQQSIPVRWRPDSRVYDARFMGTGLGWYVRDYRGRKTVQHGGAWGAEMALVPEEDLAVVVLSNRDLNGLVWMLVYDVIDAYTVGPQHAWNAGGKEWDFWLRIGGPEAFGRDRREMLAELQQSRAPDTQPTLSLKEYAGTYRSTLYCDLEVQVVDGRLHVQFGEYSAPLDHWDHDRFYGRGVIETYLDWLIEFQITDEGDVEGLEFVNIGWKDPDERFLFTR